MIIGYLHLGDPTHGVRRFGQILADAARARPELTVLEVGVTLGPDDTENFAKLTQAARCLSQAQVVHMHFTEVIWGDGAVQLAYLWRFISICKARIVVTIHDTERSSTPIEPLPVSGMRDFASGKLSLKQWLSRLKTQGRMVLTQWGWRKSFIPSNAWIRRWLVNHTQATLVCTQEEKDRLLDYARPNRVTVIPHFVEARLRLPDRETARICLGLQGYKVVTLLGFIFGGKGHDLLLHALSLIPDPDVRVVFAGQAAPGSEQWVEELMELAQELQVSDRLLVTGYLSEHELEQYLVATDVPVCPFKVCYASSSLSTWISAGRLVLAADLPQFR